MATNINTILSWFKTGQKPTQKQFWDSWQSFWHKDEQIPQNSIQDLPQTLNNKAEKSQFDSHNTDPDAHAESINKKLDKGGYHGTAKMIDDRLSAIENPDCVLKFGAITITGLKVTIAANAFNWVLNKVSFLSTGTYTETITAAANGMYRTDIIVGNSFGSYEIIKGTEAATGQAATEPNVPPGKIKVGYILVFGSTLAKSGNSNDVNLSGEIHFPAYPNTRNDGQISTNKVLTTDVNGFLKLVTIATAPAPYIDELIPDSHLPFTTGNIALIGEFFIPTMCLPANLNNGNGIQIAGQTINYATFVNSQKIIMNVTTGAAEGSFSITCNNGLTTTKNDALLIVLGTVYEPKSADWTIEGGVPDLSNDGEVHLSTYNSLAQAIWTKEFDRTKNFSFRFKLKPSPFGSPAGNTSTHGVELIGSDDGLWKYYLGIDPGSGFTNIDSSNGDGNVTQGEYWLSPTVLEFRNYNGIFFFYINKILKKTYATPLSQNLKFRALLRTWDVVDIQYIELS